MIKIEAYKLVGFLNLFEIIPDFVYPIFEFSNKLYVQSGENDKIQEFVKLKESVFSRIIYLTDDIEVLGGRENSILELNSNPIYGFQTEKHVIVCGTSREMLKFFDNYDVYNDILREEIVDFRKEVKKRIQKAEYVIVRAGSDNKRFYGTGKRKESVARVYLVFGQGKITINKRSIDDYFGLEKLKFTVRQPLAATNTVDKFDVIVTVKGGGYTSQADAVRQGIARALLRADADYGPVLKKAGYLTRNLRMKGRKNYGLKAARRASHVSKR